MEEEKKTALQDFMSKANEADLEIAKFTVETKENVSRRYLQARGYNVEKALNLLQESAEKKKSLGVHRIKNMSPDDAAKCDVGAMKKFYPHGSLGMDLQKRPILVDSSGKLNKVFLNQMTSTDSLVEYHVWTMEKYLDDMFTTAASTVGTGDKDSNINPISTCCIIDLEGISLNFFSKDVLDHLKTLVAIDNVIYPETLGKMFIVNAPWILMTVWQTIKGWLDKNTVEKIEILKANEMNKLQEFISPTNLPVAYGGICKDEGVYPYIHDTNISVEGIQLGGKGTASHELTTTTATKLEIDLYSRDGDIEVEIFSEASSSSNGAPQQASPIKDLRRQSIDKNTTVEQLHRFTMAGNSSPSDPNQNRKKLVVEVSANKKVSLIFSNSVRFSTKYLVYVVKKIPME